MKRSLILVALIAGVLVSQTQAQMAIRWKGTAGWGLGTKYESLFNHYNLQVFDGTIYRIDTITPISGMAMGIQLVLRTPTREEIPIHLGPAWYVLFQDMNLGLNDQVSVVGARFSLNGKNTVAAFEVRTREKVLMLRDSEDGIPYWCGWRKRKL